MKKWIWVLLLALAWMLPQEAEAASSGQLIIINKSTNELAFFENGELVRTFPVATGRTLALTPEGRFPIVNKIKNRPYYTDGIPGGDPRNPLGDRWLGLDARGTYGTTYAIHGNNNEQSIGKYVSAGCVRMHNKDIHWLFEKVKLKTDVLIVQSSRSFEELARLNGYQLVPPISVYVDGKKLAVSQDPFMKDNRVLVPMRSIFNALGASVAWNAQTKTVTATKNGRKIELTIDSKRAKIDGRTHMLDVAPTISGQQTFVPTRFVSEALGASVKWDGKKRIVSLLSPAKPAPQPDPATPAKTPIKVTVNGHQVEGDAFILDGVSMVPMRQIFEWLGVPFSYDAASATVRASHQGKSLTVSAGNSAAVINGAKTTLPQSPLIEAGRLYVPARVVTETFSGSIRWDGSTLHITVRQ
ncbi:L,D-transpeptidase family protein [Halalkalibacter oceani]|uniref:L,D-transpeptidase family protein n=1 Tax=Halalkalibacter oceani TaxID=1653776 RepID=UPI0032E7FEA3